MHQERHRTLKDLLYLKSWRREAQHTIWGSVCISSTQRAGATKPVESRMREWGPVVKCLYWESRWSTEANSWRDFIGVFIVVSQSGEGRDQPYRTAALAHLVGCSQLVRRNVEVSRKCELEKKITIHQEDGSSQFCHFWIGRLQISKGRIIQLEASI